MSYRETEHLRVLIANERQDRLARVAPIVAALGHDVIARAIEVADVGAVTARERPDVALVGLGASSDHALGLIEKIVQEAACPVILLLHAPDPAFVKEASKRGVFAHINDADVEDWQSSIDIVLRRLAEYHDLEGAFGRRALTERAKGILMERHAIDESSAFEMLRESSRTDNRKLIDIAAAVVDGHVLLPKRPKRHRHAKSKRQPRSSERLAAVPPSVGSRAVVGAGWGHAGKQPESSGVQHPLRSPALLPSPGSARKPAAAATAPIHATRALRRSSCALAARSSFWLVQANVAPGAGTR